MKKRALSLLLTLTMLLTLVPAFSAQADAAETHDHSDWTALTSLSSSLSGGKYYLTQDIVISSHVEVKGDVTICLNGYMISPSNPTADNPNMIWSSGNTHSLTILDCNHSTEHYFTYYSNKEWTAYSSTVETSVPLADVKNAATALVSGTTIVKVNGGVLNVRVSTYGPSSGSGTGSTLTMKNINVIGVYKGAIQFQAGSHGDIENCTIAGCSTAASGGFSGVIDAFGQQTGSIQTGPNITIKNSVITRNTNTYTNQCGIIWIRGGSSSNTANMNIRDCEITCNSTKAYDGNNRYQPVILFGDYVAMSIINTKIKDETPEMEIVLFTASDVLTVSLDENETGNKVPGKKGNLT